MKAILLIVMIVMVLQADYFLEFQTTDGKMKFYYKDNLHEKLISGEDICKNAEIYKIKKRLYSVSYDGGHLVVVNLLKAKKLIGVFGIGVESADSEDVAGVYDDYLITKTSKRKKIAGVTAHKWILEDPQTKEKKVIYVTSSKKVQKVVEGLASLFSSFSNDSVNYFMIDGSVIVESEDMKLVKFQKVTVPKSTYKLPNRKSKILKMCQKRESKVEEDSIQNPSPLHAKEIPVPKPISNDKCFAKVCCGYEAGESEVLENYLTKKPLNMFKNFALYKVAKCSDGDVEEALYVNRTNPRDIFRIRLNMDDRNYGFVKNSFPRYQGEKRNKQRGVSWYSNGDVYGKKFYIGYFLAQKMAVEDQIVNETTTLSFMEKVNKGDSKATWLVENASQYGPLDFDKFMKDYSGFQEQSIIQEEEESVEYGTQKSHKDEIEGDIQKAADILKSFF